MKITMQTAKSVIKKYYIDTIGFMPMNKDIVIKDINDDIITASINGNHRHFKANISVEDVTDRNLIAD
mgnify:CR=1 FL=1